MPLRCAGLPNSIVSPGRAERARALVSRFGVIAGNGIGQVSFRNVLGGLQEIGGLLVKRGTAMGPLVPPLALSPVLLLCAWPFRSVAVVGNIPIISMVLVITALWIVVDYHRHYSRFARTDPDRLQSEEYRYQSMRLMIATREFPRSLSAEELPLADPAANLPGSEVTVEQPTGSFDADEERA